MTTKNGSLAEWETVDAVGKASEAQHSGLAAAATSRCSGRRRVVPVTVRRRSGWSRTTPLASSPTPLGRSRAWGGRRRPHWQAP